MRILITHSSGQLGAEVARQLSSCTDLPQLAEFVLHFQEDLGTRIQEKKTILIGVMHGTND
jgi:hypothetical protein